MLGFEYAAWQLKYLPEWVDRVHERARLIEQWRACSSLVKRVVEGETTFEAVVKPLVEENLKLTKDSHKLGICNSDKFDRLSASTAADMKEVLDLDMLLTRCNRESDKRDLSSILAFALTIVILGSFIAMLSESSDAFWTGVMVAVSSVASAAIVCTALGLGYSARIEYRKSVARKILEQAKSLDRVISEWHEEVKNGTP